MSWVLHPRADLRRAPLGELTAVFHPASGETHLLSAPVLALLDRLGTSAATAEELAQASSLEDDRLTAELAALDAAGLIVRA